MFARSFSVPLGVQLNHCRRSIDLTSAQLSRSFCQRNSSSTFSLTILPWPSAVSIQPSCPCGSS